MLRFCHWFSVVLKDVTFDLQLFSVQWCCKYIDSEDRHAPPTKKKKQEEEEEEEEDLNDANYDEVEHRLSFSCLLFWSAKHYAWHRTHTHTHTILTAIFR